MLKSEEVMNFEPLAEGLKKHKNIYDFGKQYVNISMMQTLYTDK